MPTLSVYADLYLYNSTTDKDQLFIDFRDNLAGPNSDSNMQKIDRLLSNSNDRLNALEAAPPIVTVRAEDAGSPNNFVANGVAEFTAYANKMLLLIYLPVTNTGLVTININNTGVTSMQKIGSEGTIVNLDAGDMDINTGYLFQYNGTQLILVGESAKSVVTSATEPLNQPVNGLWNKLLAGGGMEPYVKQSDGTYLKTDYVVSVGSLEYADGTSLEQFKTDISTELEDHTSDTVIHVTQANKNDWDAKVPSTRTVNGKPLSANVSLTSTDVGAVPTSRTINGKALTGNISLVATDVGAVPTSRTINGQALTGNITLSAANVSAAPTAHATTATTYGVGSTTNYGHVKVTAANGLTITSGTIAMAAANGATPGTVSAGTQTFNGNKTFAGQVVVANPAVNIQAARRIYAGTTAMTSGTTALTTGMIYLQYE